MLRFILVFLVIIWPWSCFGEIDADEINTIVSEAEKNAKKMSIPVNKFTSQGMKAARKSAADYHSKEFQQTIKEHKSRLTQEVFKEYTENWTPHRNKEEVGQLEHEQIYVFLSSSIPIEIIQEWIALMSKIKTDKISFVMKGVPGGLQNIDREWFERLYRKDDNCNPLRKDCEYNEYSIKIKPVLFKKYQIIAVPAVIIETEQSSYLLSGDAGLDYMIEQINRHIKSEGLTQLIKEMRKSG